MVLFEEGRFSLWERRVVAEAIWFNTHAVVIAAGLAIAARHKIVVAHRGQFSVRSKDMRAIRGTAGGAVVLRWESRSRSRFVTHGGAADIEADIFQRQQRCRETFHKRVADVQSSGEGCFGQGVGQLL